MPLNLALYDTDTLVEVLESFEPVNNYWLSLLFNRSAQFDTEWIEFEKVSDNGRTVAPYVTPLAQGKPIYGRSSRVDRYKAAYVKMKDAVNPSRVIKRWHGEMFSAKPMTPAERHDAIVVDILRYHRAALERRWELMAAQSILNGKITISGPDYPDPGEIDFLRDAGNTVVLGVGARWGDSGVSIVDSITSFREKSWRITPGSAGGNGGPTNRLTVGKDAWKVMSKDPEVLGLLDTQTRGANADLKIGVADGSYVEFKGRLGDDLDIWMYADIYKDPTSGAVTEIMSPKDVLLSGSMVDGVQCFGAILDKQADYRPEQISARVFDENDPSVTQCLTQSSPLMVPTNINNTVKATVVA